MKKHDKIVVLEKDFAARLKKADLVNKTDLDSKLTNVNRQIASNKAKNLEV